MDGWMYRKNTHFPTAVLRCLHLMSSPLFPTTSHRLPHTELLMTLVVIGCNERKVKSAMQRPDTLRNRDDHFTDLRCESHSLGRLHIKQTHWFSAVHLCCPNNNTGKSFKNWFALNKCWSLVSAIFKTKDECIYHCITSDGCWLPHAHKHTHTGGEATAAFCFAWTTSIGALEANIWSKVLESPIKPKVVNEKCLLLKRCLCSQHELKDYVWTNPV